MTTELKEASANTPHGGRGSLINEISSWLKLLALIVLAAEAVLLAALAKTSPSDPLYGWHIPLMLSFLTIIVIGIFGDRYLQTFSTSDLNSKNKSDVKYLPNNSVVAEQNTPNIIYSSGTKTLTLELSERLALLSPTLKDAPQTRIYNLLIHKIRVHRFVFEYPNNSAIIPVDDKFFGRFSWDDEKVVCHELFEIAEDTDIEQWRMWIRMQSIYVHAYASDHRQPGKDPNLKTLTWVETSIKTILEIAQQLVEKSPDCRTKSIELNLVRLEEALRDIDIEDKSKTPRNAVVRLEMALSAAHDLIRKLMPRVISI